MKYKLFVLTISFLFLLQGAVRSQAIRPDLQDTSKWRVMNRIVKQFDGNDKKGITFNEFPGNGLMMLKGTDFSNGIIELDIQGNDKIQQSFVGVSFHSSDTNTYDAIYFRPFNFKSDDAMRRAHMVQYISMPAYDWEKLRAQFPGKYEQEIPGAPGANDWFHVKIIVGAKQVSVFVNNAKTPVLTVAKLNNNSHGGIGIWLGNNSGGNFANLKIIQSAR